MKVLLCYAAAVEAGPLADELPDRVVALGVGKVAATLAIARILAETRPAARPDAVLLFGVCGAHRRELAGAAALAVGELCVVGEDRLADEGVATESGFLDLRQLGLGDGGPVGADPGLTSRIAAALALTIVKGHTVSTCSGTDARAAELWARHPSAVESMEGAAVALACRAFAVPFAQLRAVSNATGDRERAAWDLPRACAAVQGALRRLVAEGLVEPWQRSCDER